MIIWRYGKMSVNCDLTELDQWIGTRTMEKKELRQAPKALKEAIETFLNKL